MEGRRLVSQRSGYHRALQRHGHHLPGGPAWSAPIGHPGHAHHHPPAAPRLPGADVDELRLWRPVLCPAEPEPTTGEGLQLRLSVPCPVVPRPVSHAGRRLGADRGHQGIGVRDAQRIQRSPGFPAHQRGRAGQLKAECPAELPGQLRAARRHHGTGPSDGPVRLARRLSPDRQVQRRGRNPG